MRELEEEWERQRLRGLRLVVRALQLMGAWPPGADAGAGGGGGGGGVRRRLYRAYVAAATALMASYPACALCVLAGTRADIQVTAVLVGVTSSYVGAIFKMFTLCYKRSQVSGLVRAVQREFPRSPLLAGRAQRAVAASAGQHGARLTALFVSCFSSVFNWSLGPIALHLLGGGGGALALCLPWFPDHQPAGAAFRLVYGYQVATLVLVALWVGALDAFLLVLLVYAAGQLRVLNCTLLQMGARSDDGTEGQREKFASNASAMLRECAKHHLEVCRFVQDVEQVAAPALTLQLLVSTFLLCMSAFTATQIPVGSPLLARVVVYMLTGASELLIFCKYCDDVISESERVQQALYGSGWSAQGGAFSRGVLIMLARAQRPLCLRAAHVHPVSLQTFTKVLNASYTVFTLMRQIKD
uniref:Odorant receptor n=1 Tax=Locusta migratoria TaxID=7004 RepID=A0A0M3SBN4_LOCMI|nr:odorant receptor 7 [Locusta migratoria]